MKYTEHARIIGHESIGKDIWVLSLHAPQIAPNAKPGQFVMLQLDRPDLLLPRPMSIMRIENNDLHMVYQVVGEGTRHIASLDYMEHYRGKHMTVTGPLGSGFTIDPTCQKVALVGGGLGTPPLVMLAQHLQGMRVSMDAYLGFRDTPLLVHRFEDAGAQVQIATDTGSHGHHGNIVDLLRQKAQCYDVIFACGPKPMLRALSQYAKSAGIPCQISLEERMACGLGTCVGCVIDTTAGKQKICVDGPVFASDTILWPGGDA